MKRPNKYKEWMKTGVKKCAICMLEHPVSNFYWGNGYPGGYCKECSKKTTTQGRRDNPERRLVNRRRRLVYKFGITHEQYDAMHWRQSGVCAICRSDKTWGDRRLSVDHCHKTGRVRDLLCSQCNSALGNFHDSLPLLQRAMEYLRAHGVVWGAP